MWKKHIISFKKDKVTSIIYKDRVIITHKHDMEHVDVFNVEIDKLSITTYLQQPKVKNMLGNAEKLATIQCYVKKATRKRYASPASIVDINKHKIFAVCIYYL